MRIPLEPWMTAPEPTAVLAALDAGSDSTRFVGGCVRAAVRGEAPDDLDLATTLTPDEVTRRLTEAGIKAVPTGLDHGTVTAVINHHGFEVTTLRQDVETDGRRAVVAHTTDWRVDAERRDFTMNAMSMSADGTVHDFFGGIADARAGRVRFVGDSRLRIREDVLRILRFFRFHAWYGHGAADADGLAACAELAELIPGLSRERVGKEMLKLLAAPDPVPALREMRAAGVITPILGEIESLAPLERLVALEIQGEPIRRLSVLTGWEEPQITDAWRLSKAQGKRLAELMSDRTPLSDSPVHWQRAIYERGADRFRDSVLVSAARNADTDPSKLREALDLADTWIVPDLPVAGRDIRAQGVPAGPEVGRLLRDVEKWWIDGGYVADKSSCIEQIRQLIRNGIGTDRGTDE